MDKNLLQQYNEWEKRVAAYQMALSLIEVDKQTVAPSAGSRYRNEKAAILSGEQFSLRTDPAQAELRAKLLAMPDLPFEDRRRIELTDKKIRNTMVIPKDVFVAYAEFRSNSFVAWRRAKQENDYSVFEPYLKQMIEYKKKIYGYRNRPEPIYDQMLDDYEPGMDMVQYDAFFGLMKERLLPLIQAVQQAKPIEDSFLYLDYPVAGQKEFMETILRYIGVDRSWCYQNETEHPFTSSLCENDIRITTKYVPNNVSAAVFSTVHESGHGYYTHNVAPEYDGTVLYNGISSGMQESQSRLCENYLGRTKAFWEANYAQLQRIFPEQLGNVPLDDYVRAVNVSRPTLIRTRADELTYPIHVLIRYELEKGLFDGTIPTEGLDRTWNEMYQKYLGISSLTASQGILQDVHWGEGLIGYFPTYALGSAIAAQFVHTMRRQIDVDELLRTGHYTDIIAWLRENIHKYGSLYNAREILKRVTGEDFNPEYYVEYLENKYKTLYAL